MLLLILDTSFLDGQAMLSRWGCGQNSGPQVCCKGEMVELTSDLKEVFDCWVNLTPYQKGIALQLLEKLKGLPEEYPT